MRKYPAGSLLFLKHDGKGFQVREFDGAPRLNSKVSASYLVLDGQQRLTSLYQAFYGRGEHLFFLDIQSFLDGGEVEDAVWHESLKRAERRSLTQIGSQAAQLVCPLATVFGRKGGFHGWVDEVMQRRTEKGSDADNLRSQLREVYECWILPALEYHFPVITLNANTPLEAVCKMFETLNRRGVKLTVFELLMARSFANNVSLRQLWDDAQNAYPEFEEFDIDPYYVLQIVSLISRATIKRSDVLALDPETIAEHWGNSVAALGEAIRYARKELGVLHTSLMPYHTMLVPMGALWIRLGGTKGAAIAAAKEKLSQWFWASVFSQAYEKGPSSRAVADYKELTAWIFENGSEPRVFRRLAFSPRSFYDVTVKQRALYRGTLALILSNGAKDFHKGDVIRYDYLISNKVDDHHIFPKNFLKKKSVTESQVQCVLNRTLIDKSTNLRISDNAPSKYLKEIIKAVGEPSCAAMLASHGISMDTMIADDFSGFLAERSKFVFAILKEKVKREIPETPELFGDEDEVGEDEESSRRDLVDPAIVNVRPSELLDDQPKWVEDRFNELTIFLQNIDDEIWWKLKKGSVSFFSPQKHFLTVRCSKNGLNLTLFTRDKEIVGVEPIRHKNLGGQLWGKLKVTRDSSFDVAGSAVKRGLEEMREAIKNNEATAWWAVTNKVKREGSAS